MSAGRVLIWSGDPAFSAAVWDYLTRRNFEVVDSCGVLFLQPPAELMIVDIDALPRVWWSYIAALRTRDRSLSVILVSSHWPNFARLHSWRPCGYVRKPFAMEDLMRVVRDLVPDVQAPHRRIANTDRCSPAARQDDDRERNIADSAA